MYSPDNAHDRMLQKRPSMAYDPSKPFAPQQEAIKAKILECLGDMPDSIVPLDPVVESVTEHETFTENRISFSVEEDVRAVCLLNIPKNRKGKVPLVIVVQGHGTGMHVSMGRKLYEKDHPEEGERDNGLQAIERGYASLCLEQRGFGERRTEKNGYANEVPGSPRCHTTAMVALILGRTLLGERCWDISRAIDLALTYPEIDGEKIICTGNSGGGTATYYAAVYEPRIKVAMPSSAVCTFRDSIAAMKHCECNYVPNIARFLDMGDMAAAIAPRKLVVINGKDDPIFPKKGVDETCEIIKQIYKDAGVPENFVHKEDNGAHRYYKIPAWEGFEQVTKGEWD